MWAIRARSGGSRIDRHNRDARSSDPESSERRLPLFVRSYVRPFGYVCGLRTPPSACMELCRELCRAELLSSASVSTLDGHMCRWCERWHLPLSPLSVLLLAPSTIYVFAIFSPFFSSPNFTKTVSLMRDLLKDWEFNVLEIKIPDLNITNLGFDNYINFN